MQAPANGAPLASTTVDLFATRILWEWLQVLLAPKQVLRKSRLAAYQDSLLYDTSPSGTRMGDSAATASADGEASADSAKADSHRLRPVEVADKGDTLLDVTFETSQETLRKSRKAALAAGRKANGHASSAATRALLPVVRVSYRVSLNVLKRNSQYFSNLLTNPQFKESKLIGDAHAALAARNVKPGEADAADLPRIAIVDDDEATQTAAREQIFEDMLRIMHQKPANSTRLVMSYVTTLAVIADRFDCVSVISRALNTDMKFKWPLTSSKPMVDDFGRATDAEKVLRQKLLVAWLLGQPMRLHQASRELIMRGSRAWGVTYLDDEASVNGMSAAWWNLPEGLEGEQSIFQGTHKAETDLS